MAKKATGTAGGGSSRQTGKGSSERSVARASSGAGSSGRGRSSGAKDTAGEAFIKLLQSPLVADLLAVAATAALAALAEHGFNSSGVGDRRRARAGKAVKEAGKAAAAAIGRRLSNELAEIRTASKRSKGGAEA